jgi:predicted PurR-regulated permease PerM
MTSAPGSEPSDALTNSVIDMLIKLSALAFVLVTCFHIVSPFVVPVVWGIIIAVAIYPIYLKLRSLLGGKDGLAATVFVLAGVLLLLLPTLSLGGSLIDSVQDLSAQLEAGAIDIPPPSDSVADWPIIGESLSHTWSKASSNLEDVLDDFEPQVKAIAAWLLHSLGGVAGGLLQFILSIIIAGGFLANAQGGGRISLAIADKLVGDRAIEAVNMCAVTIRSVAQGVLGVAVIQSLLAAVGLILVDVPGAELLALIILLLAVMQLPPLLVLLPVTIYVFSVESTTVAVCFAVWSVFVSISDSFLKPLLLGRGVDVPMFVILLGAIGGMIAWGVVGLFIGAIILALGYKLFLLWLNEETQPEAEPSKSE